MPTSEVREGFIEVNGDYHPIGDAQCRVCCHGTPPSPCEEHGCGGFVHGTVEDEWHTDDDHGWIHAYRCDQCGSTEVPL